ncbi:UNVERIFIED_CONTAM: hypothetical protein FKN15_066141 [Acipenser sinensis]
MDSPQTSIANPVYLFINMFLPNGVPSPQQPHHSSGELKVSGHPPNPKKSPLYTQERHSRCDLPPPRGHRLALQLSALNSLGPGN